MDVLETIFPKPEEIIRVFSTVAQVDKGAIFSALIRALILALVIVCIRNKRIYSVYIATLTEPRPPRRRDNDNRLPGKRPPSSCSRSSSCWGSSGGARRSSCRRGRPTAASLSLPPPRSGSWRSSTPTSPRASGTRCFSRRWASSRRRRYSSPSPPSSSPAVLQRLHGHPDVGPRRALRPPRRLLHQEAHRRSAPGRRRRLHRVLLHLHRRGAAAQVEEDKGH